MSTADLWKQALDKAEKGTLTRADWSALARAEAAEAVAEDDDIDLEAALTFGLEQWPKAAEDLEKEAAQIARAASAKTS